MNEEAALAVVLATPIEINIVYGEVGDSITLFDRSFDDCGGGDWIGFYDWLRSEDGTLLGVRSWLAPSEFALIKPVALEHPDLELDDRSQIRVWFTEDRTHSEWMSGDQALGTHRLMAADGRVFALLFGAEALSEAELTTLVSSTELRSP